MQAPNDIAKLKSQLSDSASSLFFEELLSAQMDGALSPAELDLLLKHIEQNGVEKTLPAYQNYLAIGEVLRSQSPTALTSSTSFLNAFHKRLEQAKQQDLQLNTPSSIKANSHQLHPAPALQTVRPPQAADEAANASSYHWKWFASVASVAAIAVIGWTNLSQHQSSTPTNGDADFQLASQNSDQINPAVTADNSGDNLNQDHSVIANPARHFQFVASNPINFSQHDMPISIIRDPVLDDLLLKQYNKKSALNAPFLQKDVIQQASFN